MTSSNWCCTLPFSMLLLNGITLPGRIATAHSINNNNTCTSTPRNSTTPCLYKTCYHGGCVVKEMVLSVGFMKTALCVCDPGWSGRQCDVCCDLHCDTGHHCTVYFHPQYSGYLQKCTANRVTDTRKEAPTESHYKSCNARERNSTNECLGLKCYHGDCITAKPSNRPWCKCDRGWTGKHCDECCDLGCPQGQCMLKTYGFGIMMQCSVSKTPNDTQPVDTQRLTHQSSQRMNLLSQGSVLFLTKWRGLLGRSDSYTTHHLQKSRDVCKSKPRSSSTFCVKGRCYHGNCSTTWKQYVDLMVKTWSCHCDKGWYGRECNLCCDLECNHGNCRVSEGQRHCNCDPGYTGNLCDVKIPPTTPATRNVTVTVAMVEKRRAPGWYWYVVGIGITAVLALMTSLVVLPLYLWWKRNIFILRVLHYFQSPEDASDGKEYDAYVSYSEQCSSDENFCVYTLYPKLEKELHFKLYLPCRDTLPGNVKAETILEAMQSSRRTILLLSPEYLLDEWPRFEYLTAQQEMLSLHHRIIPVILRDIKHVTIVDPVLKQLMTSLRCITWPAEGDCSQQNKFWKLLELALPKKSPRDRANINNTTDTVKDESNFNDSGTTVAYNPRRWFSRRAREIMVTSV